MARILVIGSTVCDVMVSVDRLPQRQGDVHIKEQRFSLGGCAFNVAHLLHQLGLSYDLISPVGTGMYGQFVQRRLEEIGMAPTIRLTGENGCCYCFVEEDGERTFLSHHGVEYLFDSKWLSRVKTDDTDYVYVCGLEVEEETGGELVGSLERLTAQIVFAPGPRLTAIPRERMVKLLALSPIVHLNQQEIIAYTRCDNVRDAMVSLYQRTQAMVIVTIGEGGSLAYDGIEWYQAPAYQLDRIGDTIGAGDSHISAMIAAMQQGLSIGDALDFANQVSAKIVSVTGTQLPPEAYEELRNELHKRQMFIGR